MTNLRTKIAKALVVGMALAANGLVSTKSGIDAGWFLFGSLMGANVLLGWWLHRFNVSFWDKQTKARAVKFLMWDRGISEADADALFEEYRKTEKP